MDDIDHRVTPMIFFGPGQCIDCGGQLYIADMETAFMALSPSGNPVTEETVVHCEAVCSHCGKRIPMMRKGLGYVPETEFSKFVKEYEFQQTILEVDAVMDSLKPTDDNPFCFGF